MLVYDKEEPVTENLITWVFDENSFVPAAKLVGDKSYSILTDHLGTPYEAYDENGEKVWARELDLYGNAIAGDSSFIPFLYQGQYYDEEIGLAYNRFRYYSPESGTYISQDPIRLARNNPNFYGYTFDCNTEVDVWGLNCSSDAAELRKNMEAAGIDVPEYENSAHHIVMSNSSDKRMEELRKKMDEKFGIGINEADNGVFLPKSSKIKKEAGTNAHAHSRVHTETYKQNVYDRLKDIDNEADFRNELKKIGEELKAGTFGI